MPLVPRNRLLLWVLLAVIPFAGLADLVPAVAVLVWTGISAFTAIVLIDALVSFSRADQVSVELPEMLRWTIGKSSRIEVGLRNRLRGSAPRTVRLGFALPPEIVSEQRDWAVQLPEVGERFFHTVTCSPVRRGRYYLNRAFLETSSRLGFWAIRKTQAVQCEIRVYPDLLSERKKMAALFINRGDLGHHLHRVLGKGREFEKLREYSSGDGMDDIHWKATAKRSHPMTKVYQIERTQEIYVCIDASRLSARKSPGSEAGAENLSGTLTLDRFIASALLLASVAERHGDLFGLMTFDDQVRSFVRASNGRNHYNACRDALFSQEPRLVSPNFDEVMSFVRVRLRRRSLLLFLTELDDPILSEDFARAVELTRRQHLVIVAMIKPSGVGPVFADENVENADDIYERLGRHFQWQGLQELERLLHQRGVKLSLSENEKFSARLVGDYLGIKQRQLL